MNPYRIVEMGNRRYGDRRRGCAHVPGPGKNARGAD